MSIRPLFRVPLTLSDPDDTIPIADYNSVIGGLPGLLSWHTAHPDYLTLDGSNYASALLDRSGNGATFSQGTSGVQPLYEADQINGQGALFFDTARGDRMSWDGTFPTGSSGHYSKLVVMEGVGGVSGSAQQILSSGNGAQDGKHYFTRSLSATGNAQAATDSSGGAVLASAAMTDDVWHLAIGSFTAGTGVQSLSVDGAVTQATNALAESSLSTLFLGGSSAAAGGLNARIAEIMIFDIDLHDAANASALNLVKSYVETTYGISSL